MARTPTEVVLIPLQGFGKATHQCLAAWWNCAELGFGHCSCRKMWLWPGCPNLRLHAGQGANLAFWGSDIACRSSATASCSVMKKTDKAFSCPTPYWDGLATHSSIQEAGSPLPWLPWLGAWRNEEVWQLSKHGERTSVVVSQIFPPLRARASESMQPRSSEMGHLRMLQAEQRLAGGGAERQLLRWESFVLANQPQLLRPASKTTESSMISAGLKPPWTTPTDHVLVGSWA